MSNTDDYQKQYRAMHPEKAQQFHADDNPTAPPQQPNRPEGLREILELLQTNSWHDGMQSELVDEAEAAIRTRIEQAIGEDEPFGKDYLLSERQAVERNKLRAEIKSNIQRELGI